jgi:hypothetical protein
VLTCRCGTESRASIEESAHRAQAEAENPRKACIGEAGDCKKRLCRRRFCESRVDRAMRALSEGKSLRALEAESWTPSLSFLQEKYFHD